MNSTSRNKNLIFIITILLLTNIGVLAYFLWFKKPPKRPDRVGMFIEMLQKEVGFTDAQIEQYKELKDQQRQTVRPMFDDMRKAKENLFRLASDSTVSDSMVQVTADAIATQQKALDLQTLNHFRRVRALCTSQEQSVKYDSAVSQMFRKMSRPAKRAEGEKQEKKD